MNRNLFNTLSFIWPLIWLTVKPSHSTMSDQLPSETYTQFHRCSFCVIPRQCVNPYIWFKYLRGLGGHLRLQQALSHISLHMQDLLCTANTPSTRTHTVTYCTTFCLCPEGAVCVACYSLVVCLASTACESTAKFPYAAMYISAAFKTHITDSELCMGLVQCRCLFYALVKGNWTMFSYAHDAQGPRPIEAHRAGSL